MLVPLLRARTADHGHRGDHVYCIPAVWTSARILLFQHEPRLVWGLIASLYVGNVMLLVLNLPLVGLSVRLLTIPRPVLYGAILILASAGAGSVNRSRLRRRPAVRDRGRRVSDAMSCSSRGAPAIIGVILGPMAEQQLRRALAIAEGSPMVLVTRLISSALRVAALLLLAGPRIVGWWRRSFKVEEVRLLGGWAVSYRLVRTYDSLRCSPSRPGQSVELLRPGSQLREDVDLDGAQERLRRPEGQPGLQNFQGSIARSSELLSLSA